MPNSNAVRSRTIISPLADGMVMPFPSNHVAWQELNICDNCATSLAYDYAGQAVPSAAGEDARDAFLSGRDRFATIAWGTGAPTNMVTSRHFSTHNFVSNPDHRACDLCQRENDDFSRYGARWTAFGIFRAPETEATADRSLSVGPSNTRRRILRTTASTLRTLCHNAQHRNTRDDYMDALTQARLLVGRLERIVATYDAD